MIFKIIENQDDHVIYFGLQLVTNRIGEDTYHFKYDLKKRPYLGPTSTDHQLAFLMANQGQIQPGDFVYDPFAGTGSIVMAC
jgi:tRNA (guanine10-N2)-methyltransferase